MIISYEWPLVSIRKSMMVNNIFHYGLEREESE